MRKRWHSSSINPHPNLLFPSFHCHVNSFHIHTQGHNKKLQIQSNIEQSERDSQLNCSSSSNLSATRIYPFAPFKQSTLTLFTSLPHFHSKMQTQKESPDKHTNPLSQLAQNMLSNNNNINNSTIMLAAIVSLLIVILFVLLLHMYAKWFLSQSHPSQLQHRRRRRRRRRRVSSVMGPSQFHHFRIEDSPFITKGLDSATVSAIPMFVYEAGETGETEEAGETEELECVICLCGFEEGEVGRSLPNCGHAFHVECIDMWLSSHSNCPICRASIVCGGVVQNDSQLGYVDGDDQDHDGDGNDGGVLEIVIGTPSYEISESELGNERRNDNVGGGGMVIGGVGGSVSETSSSLLGCSLERMLSKVFVSSNVNELDGSQ